MGRRRLLPVLLAAGVFALAGCGGGDDDGNGSGPAGESPADQILADAGLQVCKREEEQIAQSTVGPDLTTIVAFAVADDCAGSETSPNIVRVYQFSDPNSVQEGAGKAKTEYPRGVVMISGALVIVVTGPDAEANAEAVGSAYADTTGAQVTTV
jgi:hypothetical protein